MAESLIVRKSGGGLKVENGVEKNYEVADGVTITKNTFVDLTSNDSSSLYQDTLITGITGAQGITSCRLTNHKYLILYVGTNAVPLYAQISTYDTNNTKVRGEPILIDNTAGAKVFLKAVAINKDLVMAYFVTSGVMTLLLLEINETTVTLKQKKTISGQSTSNKVELLYLNNRVVIIYQNSSNQIAANLIHTITTTDFTIGARTDIDTNTSCYKPVASISKTSRFILAYTRTAGGTIQLRQYSATGTSISQWGTGNEISAGDTSSGIAIVGLGENHAMLFFKLNANNGVIGASFVSFHPSNGSCNTSSNFNLNLGAITNVDNIRAVLVRNSYHPTTLDTTRFYNNFANGKIIVTYTAASNLYRMIVEYGVSTTLQLNAYLLNNVSMFAYSGFSVGHDTYDIHNQNDQTVEIVLKNSTTGYGDWYFQYTRKIKPYSSENGEKPFGIALQDGTQGQKIKVLTTD